MENSENDNLDQRERITETSSNDDYDDDNKNATFK